MKKLKTIVINKGAALVQPIDLTEFNFGEGSLTFAVKDMATGNIIASQEYTTREMHFFTFTEELTKTMAVGQDNYEYDFMYHLNGQRFAQCYPSPIIVVETAGGAA